MTDWKHNHVTFSRLRMHYVRDGDGPTLVLQHGWLEFWYTWRKNIPALAESFDVVVPDLRGFGDSDSRRRRGWRAFLSCDNKRGLRTAERLRRLAWSPSHYLSSLLPSTEPPRCGSSEGAVSASAA